MYKFLRIEYWSEDFVSEEYRNDTGVNQPFKTDDDTLPDSSFFLAIQLVPLAIVLLLAATWYNQNSIRARTGRHKKIDDSLDC